MTDAVQLAQRILDAEGQPFATLSLAQGFAPVTVDTPVPDARRCYMRLAGAIHPDRLQGSFDKATEAFQCLVRAFECFADPKSRKQAAAALAAPLAKKKTKAAEGAPATRQRKSATVPLSTTPPRERKATKVTTASAKDKRTLAPRQASGKAPVRARPATGEEDAEGDSEYTESASESEFSDVSAADEFAWEKWAASDTAPEVSTNRTPIGQPRVGGPYQLTTIGCPKCRTPWEPDSRPQYSLFMGQWGKKVHCQLCLFHFGSATALHGCPHCQAPFDYDASHYDSLQTCGKCKKSFGFPYYPVSQHLIDQIALEEWRYRTEQKKASEREARARARRGAADATTAEEERLQLLIGSCIMDEECPHCHQRVKSKHRAHVLACISTTAEERAVKTGKGKAQLAAGAATAQPKRTKAPTTKTSPSAPAKRSAAAARPPTTTARKVPVTRRKSATAAPKRKRQRRHSASDEDSVSETDDDSKDTTTSSESSFDDDDDNSD